MKKALALALLLGICGCVNVARERRENLKRDVEATKAQDMPKRREQLRELLLGGKQPRDPDPHLRATCAQLLGEVGDPDDLDTLLSALMGVYADDSVMVRLECAIAVGKLHYPAITDRRRKHALSALTARLANERDFAGRIIEGDYSVRNAMINSLAALGHRDAASCLLDVARRIHSDLINLESSIYAEGGEQGLLDLCLECLVQLTGVSRQKARENRAAGDDIETHFKWWSEHIADMPQVPLG